MGDFDFLTGSWTVANRMRAKWLVSSDDWNEFPATSRCVPFLDGAANTDEIVFPTRGYTGLTFRLFDQDRTEWSIWWVDSRRGVLTPPVAGRFAAGVGTFYGDDTHGEVPVRVRYLWSRMTPTSARWQQAFSTDGGKTWETNWVMDFTRVDDAANAGGDAGAAAHHSP